MKIHIPEQTFEIDETGYGRIKFELPCESCTDELPEAAPQPEEVPVVEAPAEVVAPSEEVPAAVDAPVDATPEVPVAPVEVAADVTNPTE